MAEQQNWGLWFGIAGTVAGLGGLYLAWSSEKRRRKQKSLERRCDGWHALSHEQIGAYYDAAMSDANEAPSPEFFGCLAIELEERGMPAEAADVWQRVIDRQVAEEPLPLPEIERCEDFIDLSDAELADHYRMTTTGAPLGEDYLACLVSELQARGLNDEAYALRGRMQ